MSDCQHRRWLGLVALGLPLYLAGCGGTAPTALSADRPALTVAAASESDSTRIDLIGVGDRLRANGDALHAARLYQQAHLANPQSTAPLIRLGGALMALGANAEAADAYSAALTLEPKNLEALRGLGIARVIMAQPQFAVAQFEAALAIDPRDVRTQNGLGVALDMTGAHQAAQERYRAALEIDPNNHKVLNNLGLSLALSGDEAESVAVLERVNAAPAATALTRQNLALAYGLSGRLEAAAQIARMDLKDAAVQRNLAFYAAHQTAERNHDLAQALGIERNGMHYLASRPSASDVPLATAPASDAPDTETPDMDAPAAAPTPAVIEEVIEPPQAARDLPDDTGPPPAEPVVAPASVSPAGASDETSRPPRQEADGPSTVPAAPAAVRPVLTMQVGSGSGSPVYHVQLAAYRSADEATTGWKRLATAEAALLGDHAPIIREVDLGPDKGVFFRLQTGRFTEHAEASGLCRDLLARQIDCMVVEAAPIEANDAVTRLAADDPR